MNGVGDGGCTMYGWMDGMLGGITGRSPREVTGSVLALPLHAGLFYI